MATRGANWVAIMRDILSDPLVAADYQQQGIRNMNTIERYYRELFTVHFECDRLYHHYGIQLYFQNAAQRFQHAEEIINDYAMAGDDEDSREYNEHELYLQMGDAMARWARLVATFGEPEDQVLVEEEEYEADDDSIDTLDHEHFKHLEYEELVYEDAANMSDEDDDEAGSEFDEDNYEVEMFEPQHYDLVIQPQEQDDYDFFDSYDDRSVLENFVNEIDARQAPVERRNQIQEHNDAYTPVNANVNDLFVAQYAEIAALDRSSYEDHPQQEADDMIPYQYRFTDQHIQVGGISIIQRLHVHTHDARMKADERDHWRHVVMADQPMHIDLHVHQHALFSSGSDAFTLMNVGEDFHNDDPMVQSVQIPEPPALGNQFDDEVEEGAQAPVQAERHVHFDDEALQGVRARERQEIERLRHGIRYGQDENRNISPEYVPYYETCRLSSQHRTRPSRSICR